MSRSARKVDSLRSDSFIMCIIYMHAIDFLRWQCRMGALFPLGPVQLGVVLHAALRIEDLDRYLHHLSVLPVSLQPISVYIPQDVLAWSHRPSPKPGKGLIMGFRLEL